MKDYMIYIGEYKGKIIEVPDIILFGSVILFLGFLFSLTYNNN